MALSKCERNLVLCENTYLMWFALRGPDRREWVHEVNKDRLLCGEYHHLFKALRKFETRFFEYMRMSIDTFDYILSRVEDDLEKQITNWRNPINAEERLVLTIRYLATGAQFKSLAFSFRMGASTVKAIVLETCKIIWNNLVKDHMPPPTAEIMEKSKSGFWELWNFPNCVGALDGKHCRIKCPPHSGSAFYNYKKFFSLVLQAVSDPNYKFLTVEVGGKGRQNDGGTFATSALYDCLRNNSLNIPPDCELPQSDVKVPNVLVADEAYPLKPYLLKPYARKNLTPAKTVFNYRLSRARRCIECAFGILFAKWRILGKDIETNVQNATHIIKCACLLHNVVRDKDGNSDPVYREVRFFSRRGGPIHTHRRNNRYTTRAQNIRDKFAEYIKTQKILKGVHSNMSTVLTYRRYSF